MWLRVWRWRDRALVDPELVKLALASPVPADLPRTGGAEAPMLPNQRTIGGGRNIIGVGPGYYSFNWWTNGTGHKHRRMYIDASPDTRVATGHGRPHMLWIIPSLDLIVSWNDSKIEDHDDSPGNPHSKCNQAARLIRESVLALSPPPPSAPCTAPR